MDIVKVQKEIEGRIAKLEAGMKVIEDTGSKLALAEAEYDRDLALAMLGIEHNSVKEIEGIPIGKVTTTTLRDKARGVCWQARLRLSQAENSHKVAKMKMETIAAQLNAWQSIFRHLEQTNVGA